MQPATTSSSVTGYPTAVAPGTTVSRPGTVVGQHTVVSSPQPVGTTAAPPVYSGQTTVTNRTAGQVIQAPPVYVSPTTQTTSPTTTVIRQGAAPVQAGTRTITYVQGGTQTTVPTYTQGGAQIAAPTYTQAGGVSTTTRVIRSSMPTAPVVHTMAPAGVQVLSSAQVAQSRPHAGPAGPSYTQQAYEHKHQDDPQLQNLKELRRTSGLKNVPVGDGLASLKVMAVDGKLTREQFLTGYEQLLRGHSMEVPPKDVQNAVFDLFDRDDNHVVDMMELICGISLLCCGTEDDKIHAVFNVFDEDGDGFISMDEMFKFLTSVFKVVLTPNVMNVMNSMGVTVESPEDLASVTALECFKTADLNHDGKLSVTEFKNWFYAPRNDPSFLFSPVRKLLQ